MCVSVLLGIDFFSLPLFYFPSLVPPADCLLCAHCFHLCLLCTPSAYCVYSLVCFHFVCLSLHPCVQCNLVLVILYTFLLPSPVSLCTTLLCLLAPCNLTAFSFRSSQDALVSDNSNKMTKHGQLHSSVHCTWDAADGGTISIWTWESISLGTSHWLSSLRKRRMRCYWMY